MSPTTVQEREQAIEPVLRWRLEQLQAAGYSRRHARVLGEQPHVDLHVAVGLLQAGCPVETALRILL